MAKKSTAVTKKSFVTDMTTGANVGMNEVVSVFISQYETTLHDKKSAVSKRIKIVKAESNALDKQLLREVDSSEYNFKIPVVNLVSKVKGSPTLEWKNDPVVEDDDDDWSCDDDDGGKAKKSSIVISVEIKDAAKSDSHYASSISKSFRIKISKNDQKKHTSFETELTDLNSELLEVLGLIKSVSRKERQVRGEIAARKLKESGYDELLQDEGMLKLIQID